MNLPGQTDYNNLNAPEPMGGGNPSQPASPLVFPKMPQKATPSSPNPPLNQPSPVAPAPAAPNPPPAPPVAPPPVVPMAQNSPSQPKPPQPPAPPVPPVNPPANFPGNGSKRSCGPWFLISILIIILVLAILVFISWKGWFSLGPLDKLWGRGATPSSPQPSYSTTTDVLTPPATMTNDEKRKKDLASIKAALTSYYAERGNYPATNSEIKVSDPGNALVQALSPDYLTTVPTDPLAPQYYYGYKSDGSTFQLSAVLEDNADPSGTVHGNVNIYTITDSSGE